MTRSLVSLGLVAALSLAACDGSSGGGSAGSPAPAPAAPAELAAFARAGVGADEVSTPRVLNDVELTTSEDNPADFDDLFQ